MSVDAYSKQIEAHYSSVWAQPTARVRWERGPIQELPSDFVVLMIPRSHETTAYATECMSQPADVERTELHLLSREHDEVARDSIAEILTAIAHYHRHGQPLGLGHTVNLGRPWLPGSRCTRGLISLPYLDGPDLEWMAEPEVRFLWLVPVTEEEVEFKKQNGLEALEERFEASQFDYLDPLRRSVV